MFLPRDDLDSEWALSISFKTLNQTQVKLGSHEAVVQEVRKKYRVVGSWDSVRYHMAVFS